jgi:hypothetical protein
MQKSMKSGGGAGSRVAAIVCLCLLSLALTACDKCGNSIFGSNAGPMACKEKLPQ